MMNVFRNAFAVCLLLSSLSSGAQCPGVLPKFSWANDGSSIVFTDQTEAGVSITDRLWHFGDGDSSDAMTVTHGYALAGPNTVTLTVHAEGCAFSTSALVAHGGVNDACGSQLVSSFTSEVAGNNHLVFTDQSQGDSSFLLYLWTFGDDSVSIYQDTDHFYVSPGTYDVSHSIGTVDSLFQTACVAGSARRLFVDGNTSTCDSSLFLDLNINEGLNPAPFDAQLVLFNEDLTVTGWYWDYGDGTTSVGISQEHYYAFPGTYQICTQVYAFDSVDSFECFARSCVTLEPAAVSVEEMAAPAQVRARPVPFTDELWVEGPAVQRGTRWHLLDVLGREVLMGIIRHDGSERFDTGPLPTGIYSLVLWAEGTTNPLRLLKQ